MASASTTEQDSVTTSAIDNPIQSPGSQSVDQRLSGLTKPHTASPSSETPEHLKQNKQLAQIDFKGPVLTGAAALAEEKRAQNDSNSAAASPNPNITVVRSLMSDQSQSTSKSIDAPTRPAAPAAVASDAAMPMTDEPMQIDQDQAHTPTNPESVHDPRLTDPTVNGDSAISTSDQRLEERSNKAFTYPPRPDQVEGRDTPTRGMSLPNATSKSPGSRKHRCSHCGTEFTRHHNLKSHLLTHSQEKPFCCERCDQKFRRLHDLKRHTKLHTGERPHTCHKCGRAFARGDALARHNKGPGGCAGRRGSGGDEDLGDGEEGMEDVVYDDNGDLQSSKRRKSEQAHNRKRSFQSTMDSSYRQHSSTYPGVAPMLGVQPHGQMNGPPQSNHLSPRMNNGQSQFPSQLGAAQSVFSQGGMTESPKPLSPGAEQSRRLSAGLPYPARARSPSLAQQHRLSHGTSHGSPSITGLPANSGHSVLPSIGSLASEKSSLPSSAASGMSGSKSSRPPPVISTSHVVGQGGPNSASSTNPPSASSQNRSSGGSMREILNPGPLDDRTQEFIRKSDAEIQIRRVQDDANAKIQQLDARLHQFENLVQSLTEENNMLKAAQSRPTQPVTQVEPVQATH